MICVSICEKNDINRLESFINLNMAEIRMDRMALTLEEVREIFSMSKNLIATYRPDKNDDGVRLKYLLAAIEAGARYVDIELETDIAFKKEVMEKAKSKDCSVIISFHDYEKTPSDEALKERIDLSLGYGADLVKIACKANSLTDSSRLLGLFNVVDDRRRLIVVGMGEKGRITRIASVYLGSPFTFVSPGRGKEGGDGQFSIDEMEMIVRLIDGKLC